MGAFFGGGVISRAGVCSSLPVTRLAGWPGRAGRARGGRVGTERDIGRESTGVGAAGGGGRAAGRRTAGEGAAAAPFHAEACVPLSGSHACLIPDTLSTGPRAAHRLPGQSWRGDAPGTVGGRWKKKSKHAAPALTHAHTSPFHHLHSPSQGARAAGQVPGGADREGAGWKGAARQGEGSDGGSRGGRRRRRRRGCCRRPLAGAAGLLALTPAHGPGGVHEHLVLPEQGWRARASAGAPHA